MISLPACDLFLFYELYKKCTYRKSTVLVDEMSAKAVLRFRTLTVTQGHLGGGRSLAGLVMMTDNIVLA